MSIHFQTDPAPQAISAVANKKGAITMKKALSLILAAGLILSAAACGQEGGSSASSSGSSAASPSSSSTGSSTGSSGEKTTFTATFLKNEWHGDPNDMEILKELADRANVEVEWQIYTSSAWKDKKNLIFAGGDLPDVFYMGALSSTDIVKYAPQGMFLELDGLIEQYCPRLSQVLEDMPHFKAACVNPEDGKLYSIGRAVEREVQNYAAMYYINKTWLDKLGLAVPETTDDFYNVLKAFKEKDPNGNGEADEIPFAFYGNLEKPQSAYMYGDLFGAFGYPDSAGTTIPHTLKDEATGEIIYVPMQEEYKEAIAFYSKFVQEGLWDKESFTYTDLSPYTAKGNNDPQLLGCFSAFSDNFIIAPEYVKDYVILPPLKGPDGTQTWMRYASSNNNISGNFFSITPAAEGKEEAIMRWLDEHFDLEMSIQLFLGPIGTTLQKDESGYITYVDTPEGLTYSDFRYGNAPVHVPSALPTTEWNKTIEIMLEDASKLPLAKEVYGPYVKYANLYVRPTQEQTNFLLSTGTDVTEYVNKMQVKWLTEGGIESEWDSYLKELEKLGVQDYIEMAKVMDAATSGN